MKMGRYNSRAERRFCKPQGEASKPSTGSKHELTSRGLKPNGAARDCGSRSRGFDSLLSLQHLCGPVAQLVERLSCKEDDVVQLHPCPPSFGFVAQTVERHVEGVSVAVSKSAEATKLSARSLAWLEALALGASSREFKSLRADQPLSTCGVNWISRRATNAG